MLNCWGVWRIANAAAAPFITAIDERPWLSRDLHPLIVTHRVQKFDDDPLKELRGAFDEFDQQLLSERGS
jgi:hypothetical protein